MLNLMVKASAARFWLPEQWLQLLWFAVCLAMGSFGYGNDSDGWLTAHSALRLWHKLEYIPSRGLGNPLFEWLITPLVALGGHKWANAFVAISGLWLWQGMQKLSGIMQWPHSHHVAVWMFSPLIMNLSSSTLDFIPALALWVWAIVWRKNFLLSSICLLAMVGMRPAWLWLLAVTPLLYPGFRAKHLLTLLLSAAIPAFVYVRAFDISLQHIPLPNLSSLQLLQIGAYNILQLGGVAAFVGIGWSVLTRKKNVRVFSPVPTGWVTLVVVVNLLQFIIFPYEAAYLLPAWLLSWLAFPVHQVKPIVLRTTVFMLLSYHVVQLNPVGGTSGRRHIGWHIDYGFTIRAWQDRQWKKQVREALNQFTPAKGICLLYGASWIPVANTTWEQLSSKLFHKIGSNLYIAEKIYTQADLKLLQQMQLQPVLLAFEMWDYEPLFEKGTLHKSDFLILPDIESLVGKKISGKPLNAHD